MFIKQLIILLALMKQLQQPLIHPLASSFFRLLPQELIDAVVVLKLAVCPLQTLA